MLVNVHHAQGIISVHIEVQLGQHIVDFPQQILGVQMDMCAYQERQKHFHMTGLLEGCVIQAISVNISHR